MVPSHTVTQKDSFPRAINRAFALIDRELEPFRQECGDRGHDPFAAGFGGNVDVASSSARESHPHALTEPDVNLSAHPAPIAQPLTVEVASEQITLAVSPQCGLTIAVPFAGDLLVSCISSLPTSPEFG